MEHLVLRLNFPVKRKIRSAHETSENLLSDDCKCAATSESPELERWLEAIRELTPLLYAARYIEANR
jgi:hypothetical protein